jgi:hypothetical protein
MTTARQLKQCIVRQSRGDVRRLITISVNHLNMSRFHTPTRRLQAQSGLNSAADAAGYAIAGFEDPEIRKPLFLRLGRFAYGLIFAPMIFAVAAIATVAIVA